nr:MULTISPECIES: protein-glutamate O-methyltransferase CheR [unclassified Leptolyngbya]
MGLDANSVGSRIIARAVAQRQAANGVRDRSHYLALLRSAPEELNQLIEAVVIPETWFFRDKEPFEYLRYYVKERAIHAWERTTKPLYVLSVPCSTGEEPYSIAMTLLDAGLTTAQFQIDAVDVSQRALQKAEQAVYGKSSFRGVTAEALERYVEPTARGHQVRPMVRKSVNFIHGNILQPHFLRKTYHVIFCRNLLIYLDGAARDRTMATLDHALFPTGLLFLGAAETSQISGKQNYKSIEHSSAFAYQKQSLTLLDKTDSNSSPALNTNQSSIRHPLNKATFPKTKYLNPPSEKTFDAHQGLSNGFLSKTQSDQGPPILLERAKQLADQGQLTQAAQLCESYVRANPAEASAYLLLGEICQGLSQNKQAETYFQKAIYLDPSAYEALIHLALLKEQQGNQAASEKLRKRAQRLVEQGYHSS